MTRPSDGETMIGLDPALPIWERVFTVSPLVVVGTCEGDGFNLAPKHSALPLGGAGHFGFVCTVAHATYRNVQTHEAFTVSYPDPEQVVLASLGAAPRGGRPGDPTPALESLPTDAAREVEGRVLRDALLVLECELDRVIDGFGHDSLVIGRVVAARARRDALRASEVDDADLLRRAPLLAYVHPGRWAEISDTRSFPFPAGFRR